MTIVAVSHGYPPAWNMGGEVSLHRSLKALDEEVIVLTRTDEEYSFEGISVKPIAITDVLNPRANPIPLANQLRDLNARVVIAQNELSLPAVRAARTAKTISLVSVHTPPRYGRGIKDGLRLADYAVYNTRAAAKAWGEPDSFVLHPPVTPLPADKPPKGDAYTLLSSLRNKGVTVALELAKRYPHKRFIIVRSPAEITHGLPDLEEQAAALPNVELMPRVAPEEVCKYLRQTRILLVPSRYETYGMSTLEAAGYGIPTIHVNTPDVREGIGKSAYLIPPLGVEEADKGIQAIEAGYVGYSRQARLRAEEVWARQWRELKAFNYYVKGLEPRPANRDRQRAVARASVR